ncbi:hypothetical protein [Cerasicoccus fimbriatus]|uniref:hypothetical protein n=1 Tax=Cerasicoccus fimbriatus TaxID=3014554 RepID=UPI0022B43495|nr:hypothetical protein [Cerasicoccus sp. TK19100]
MRTPIYFALLLLPTLSLLAKPNVTYPEVFEEFINGWVDYDDGAYASALRAFARANNQDPEFYPAREAMQASLLRMRMPEIAQALTVKTRRRVKTKISYEPILAFWGLYHDAALHLENSAPLEEAVYQLLEQSAGLPVTKLSPTSQAWDERGKITPGQFNAIALAYPGDSDDSITISLHLMGQFNIADSQALDVEIEGAAQWQLKHKKWILQINKANITELATTPELQQDIREMIDGELKPVIMPFIVDEETAAMGSVAALDKPWDIISKAAVSAPNPDDFLAIAHKFGYDDLHDWGYYPVCFGYPDWLAHQLPVDHPQRPWLLGIVQDYNRTYGLYDHDRVDEIRNEIIRDYPGHEVGMAVRLTRLGGELDWANRHETSQQMLTLLSALQPHLTPTDNATLIAKK